MIQASLDVGFILREDLMYVSMANKKHQRNGKNLSK